MNERIEELFGQALDEVVSETWSKLTPGQVTKLSEKFAELVVKDCMAMCDELKEEYFKHRKNTMDFDEKHIYAEGESACFNLRFKMKKRFGVEE